MDILCRKCGEPWDMDTLHERTTELIQEKFPNFSERAYKHPQYDKTYREVSADFRQRGCIAIVGRECKPQKRKEDDLTSGEKAGLLYDLLGDDLDGAASMIDDMNI